MSLQFAFLEIAYDNGCVNRSMPESKVLDKMWGVVRLKFDSKVIADVDKELSAMPRHALEELCSGEESEQPSVSQNARDILEHAFNHMV
jgi:hypothetical protein